MTTDTVGGVWVYCLELCKALQKYNVEIHLAALGKWPSEEQEKEVETLENVTLYKSDFKLEWMQDPWEDVEKSRKWINCIYQTIQPDLVHLNNYLPASEDWTCPKITVFHSCVQTWWKAVKGTSAPSMWDKYVDLVQDSLENSDVVVSPTNAILEEAKNSHHFTSKSKVIYNGREIQFSEKGKKEPIILCMGRIWDEAKNLKLLSKVAKRLPWPVYIAGNNEDPLTGEEIKLKNVIFLGKLGPKEVQEWMERASIFVSPTKYEPFGLAILEAAKASCALILSDISTLKEVWEDSAVYFNPIHPEEAEEKVLQLINNAEIREEYAKKAKIRSENYSTEKMGDAYFKLYKKARKRKLKLAAV